MSRHWNSVVVDYVEYDFWFDSILHGFIVTRESEDGCTNEIVLEVQDYSYRNAKAALFELLNA